MVCREKERFTVYTSLFLVLNSPASLLEAQSVNNKSIQDDPISGPHYVIGSACDIRLFSEHPRAKLISFKLGASTPFMNPDS